MEHAAAARLSSPCQINGFRFSFPSFQVSDGKQHCWKRIFIHWKENRDVVDVPYSVEVGSLVGEINNFYL